MVRIFWMKRQFTDKFKEAMVAKILSPNAPSIEEVARKIGIHRITLSRWIKDYGNSDFMKKKSKITPHNWKPEDKLQAVIAISTMNENEVGEYLRKQGLHSTHIEEWKKEMLAQLDLPTKKKRSGRQAEITKLKKEKKALEKELKNKMKALAETSALLVLKKKASLIWGEIEEDE